MKIFAQKFVKFSLFIQCIYCRHQFYIKNDIYFVFLFSLFYYFLDANGILSNMASWSISRMAKSIYSTNTTKYTSYISIKFNWFSTTSKYIALNLHYIIILYIYLMMVKRKHIRYKLKYYKLVEIEVYHHRNVCKTHSRH